MTDKIREDLGSVNGVFDRAVHGRLDAAKGRGSFGGKAAIEWTTDGTSKPKKRDNPLDILVAEIDWDPYALRDRRHATNVI